MKELSELVTSTTIALQEVVADRWVRMLNSTKRYLVYSAYDYLTTTNIYVTYKHCYNVWLKAVPLKVYLFA